jgi:tetratricopeptide (TPR) repeat protein
MTGAGPPKFWDLGSGQEAVAPTEGPGFADAFLGGRTRWAQNLGDLRFEDPSPTLSLAKTSAAGAGTLLATDRFRLVAEPGSVKLWPNRPATPPAAAEMARGTDLVRRGRPDAAAAVFRSAAQLARADAEPRLLLADALDRQGRHGEAVAALDDACRLDPACAWMFADLARSFQAEGRHDRALELLTRAVRLRPRDAALQFQLAEAFARAGALDKAVGCYEQAIALYPDHADAWARLEAARTALGRPEEGRRARVRAAEISPAFGSPARSRLAQALAERVRKDSAGGLDFWLTVNGAIGSRLLNESYLDEAIDYLRRQILIEPPGDQLEVAPNLATALLRRGQYAEALTVLRLIQRIVSPDDREWRDRLARRFRDAERGPERDALRKKVLEAEASFRRQPTDAAGRSLAALYTQLLDEPRSAWEKLAADAPLPDDPGLWCELAGLMLLQRQTDLYPRLCERADPHLEHSPVEFHYARHKYLTARLWGMAEKPSVATARLLEVARQPVVPEHAAARLHALGLACYRAGQYEDALRHLHESVAEHPEWSAQVLNYQALALAYHRQGKDDEARRWRAKATAWIEQTAEEVGRTAPYAWPLQQYDLLEMWLLERELAQALPAPGR